MPMLIITRRNGESLFVTKDIQIRVMGVKGNQVRLGVSAPRQLCVYREEVAESFGSPSLVDTVTAMADVAAAEGE